MQRNIVLLGIVLSSSLAAAEPAFAPGAWEHKTTPISVLNAGAPLWVAKLYYGATTRKSCSGPEIVTHPDLLLTQDDEAVCKVRKMAMAGGKFAFDTFCTNKKFPDGLLIASTGTYTPTSYTIATTSTGIKDGKPVKIVTTGTGQRVAPSCSK